MKRWSETQPIIALSSGESDLAAIVRSAAEWLGFLTVMRDFGFHNMRLTMRSDATAAIGMVAREGLGRETPRHGRPVDTAAC